MLKGPKWSRHAAGLRGCSRSSSGGASSSDTYSTTSGGCCRDASSTESLLDVVWRVLYRRVLLRPGAFPVLPGGPAVPLGTHRRDRRRNIVVRLDCDGRSRQCGRRRGGSAAGRRAAVVTLG